MAAQNHMTGADLAAIRKAAGFTQGELAGRVGIGRQAVSYWEGKPRVNRRAWAVRRMAEVLTLPDIPPVKYARASWAARQAKLEAQLEAAVLAQLARWLEADRQAAARRRVTCGALTRKGTPCRLKSEPGRRRCKFHGGLSTGPRTTEGRARIVDAQRRRWARWRAETDREP